MLSQKNNRLLYLWKHCDKVVLKLYVLIQLCFPFKVVMGQNYIYYGLEYNLIGSYSAQNGLYFITSWKFKCFYGWSNLDCVVTRQYVWGLTYDNIPCELILFLLENNPLKANIVDCLYCLYKCACSVVFLHRNNPLFFLWLHLASAGPLSFLKNHSWIMDSTSPLSKRMKARVVKREGHLEHLFFGDDEKM